MGIVSKQDRAAVHVGFGDMSYTALDEVHVDSTDVKVGSYKARIGGVSGCWTTFNKEPSTHRIDDSELFAFFSKSNSKNNDSSWKIHLSIHPNDLNRAWDFIYPILMAHEVPRFKTTRNTVSQIMYTAMSEADTSTDALTPAEKEQALRDIIRVFNGMQITIYIPEGKEREYNELLEQIEPILYQAGIRPGVIDKSDRALGIYSSVRNEGVEYTSHDKVSGYKVATLQDPFQAIGIEWNKVEITWGGLDYARHVHKAQGLFFQMLDAEKKYTQGMSTKKEFEQVYNVAREYFKRWHTLLEKTAPKDLAALATRDQAGFLELNEWVEKGHEFLPSIRKHNVKKVKEAEDVLARAPRVNTLSIKPVPLLKRKQAHVALNKEVVVKSQVDVVKPVDEPKLVKRESSAKALQELKAFRKDSFNDPLLDMQLKEVLNKPKASKSSTRVFWGMFDGLLIGAALGLALSIAFAPWALVICLSLSASGMAIGGVVGHYTTQSSQDADKQPLIKKMPVETKAAQATAPHKSSKSLGFFDYDAGDADDEHQLVAQPTHIQATK